MSHLTYAEAIVTGLIQGVTELFPISSLGHNVLIPALAGGRWAKDLSVSAPGSPYLAFIVGMHVATAVAMIGYFWRDWVRIIRGFFSSIAQRRADTTDQRLAWMIILATIPVGIAGLALQHLFQTVFSKPIPTALFLAVNGGILLAGERLRRLSRPAIEAVPTAGEAAMAHEAAAARQARGSGAAALQRETAGAPAGTRSAARHSHRQQTARELESGEAVTADRRLARVGYGRAVVIGSAQILALLPGISRDGIVMVTGMFRGLSREDAARFSFLLSAPVILAAGALKVPDLMGAAGNGIRGQVLVGSLLSGVGALASLWFLVRYFRKSRTLTPFAVYCLLAGLGSLAYFTLR